MEKCNFVISKQLLRPHEKLTSLYKKLSLEINENVKKVSFKIVFYNMIISYFILIKNFSFFKSHFSFVFAKPIMHTKLGSQ